MVSGKGLVHAAGMVKRNFFGADLIATKSPLDSLKVCAHRKLLTERDGLSLLGRTAR